MNQIPHFNLRITATGNDGERMRYLPGEPGVWLFIFLDLFIFTFIFFVFVFSRSRNIELYDTSQQALNPVYGLTYTLLLLASSWCVAKAMKTVRSGVSIEVPAKLITWAFYFGAAFAGLKLVEYTEKIRAGITPLTNEFFNFYFCLTLIHLFHATVGLFVLLFMRSRIRTISTSEDTHDRSYIESGASYWHMVDLVWIVLFALLYLRS